MGNKILIVEDDDQEIKDIVNEFSKYGILKERLDVARNLAEANAFIGDFTGGIRKYVAIILDGILEKHSEPVEDTIMLLRKIRESKYKGFIISASYSENATNFMMRDGCTHKIPNFKSDAAKIVMDLLEENKN